MSYAVTRLQEEPHGGTKLHGITGNHQPPNTMPEQHIRLQYETPPTPDKTVLKLSIRFSMLRFNVSMLRFNVPMLRFNVSMLRFNVSILRFNVSMLRFNVSILRFNVYMLRFNVSMLMFNVSLLVQGDSERKVNIW